MVFEKATVKFLNDYCKSCRHAELILSDEIYGKDFGDVFVCKYYGRCREKYETVLEYYRQCIEETFEDVNVVDNPT